MIPGVGVGQHRRRAGSDVRACDFRQVPHSDARDVGDAVERPRARRSPKRNGSTAAAGAARRRSTAARQSTQHEAHRHRIGRSLSDGACRPPLASGKHAAYALTRTEGLTILTVPEKLKAAKLWENLTPADADRTRAAARRRRPWARRPARSSTRARIPAARRRISSSCASRPANATSTGATRTRAIDEARFDALCAIASQPTSPNATSTPSIATSEPTNAIALPLRVYTEFAWHNLFAHHLFITPERRDAGFIPEFTVVDAALFQADPERDGTRTLDVHARQLRAARIILIGGTRYAGEIKKSVFTIMNYLLPLRDTLPMHCSANVGEDGDVAIFFGLSGTGKTTLSSDSLRPLIGDDEHGWSADGVFNFEGGCYAKVIRFRLRRAGDLGRDQPFLDRARKRCLRRTYATPRRRFRRENREHAIGLSARIHPEHRSGQQRRTPEHDRHAHGRRLRRAASDFATLTPEQAMYHFLSGYTAKVAGTERGVTEPQATFSTCFGAPFMVHHPTVYAKLLGFENRRSRRRTAGS